MSRLDDLKKLLGEHERHLQKLREQEAKLGVHTPPYILTEIEDREAALETLQAELAALEQIDIDLAPPPAASAGPSTLSRAGHPSVTPPPTRPHPRQPVTKRYRLRNIRDLLTEGFTAKELRRLCHDADEFRPVYDELTGHTGKTEIVDKLLEYAYRQLQLDPLLNLTREENPARYQQHQPYYDLTPSTIRILLVDDNADWRQQLGGLLGDHGYEVVTAASRQAAIQRINHDEPYHLALIDMRLDEENEEDREGVMLGFWLRENGYNLPVIIMTAYNMEAELARNITLRPFQFPAVEKSKIGSGGVADLLIQIELAIHDEW